MVFSSVSVVTNALRLRRFQAQRDASAVPAPSVPGPLRAEAAA